MKDNPDTQSDSLEHAYLWHDRRGPREIEHQYRLVLGKLAPILERRGYLKGDHRGMGVWREWDRSGSHHPSNARPFAPGLELPPEFKPVIERYSATKTKAETVFREIGNLKRERKQAQAKRRWESL